MVENNIKAGRYGNTETRRCGDSKRGSPRVSPSSCLRVIIRLVSVIILLLLLIDINQAIPAEKTGFKPALPGWKYEFPRDHRAHREFKIEWWYYNGYLRSPEGQRFGYQVTFFRIGLTPGPIPKEGSRWRIGEVYMAHMAVTDTP